MDFFPEMKKKPMKETLRYKKKKNIRNIITSNSFSTVFAFQQHMPNSNRLLYDNSRKQYKYKCTCIPI